MGLQPSWFAALRILAPPDFCVPILNMASEASSDSTSMPQALSTEGLVQELLRARQHASELCIAMLEVDYFKHISHKHGDRAGDYVLHELIRVVRSRLDRDQLFARFGEQFVITSPHTSLDEATSFAENLRAEVQAHWFIYQDERIQVTISVACAQWNEAEESAENLIERLDEQHHRARNSNRVLP